MNTALPVSADEAPTPEFELPGDSNDQAAEVWTPPVALETGLEQSLEAGGPEAWLPGIVRDVVHDPLPTPIPTATSIPTGPIVYLTFDDGPHPTWTGQILDLLAAYNAKATFFVVGTYAFANPTVFARQTDEGQGIGNHTYGHPWLSSLSASGIASQISWSFSGGSRACGFTDCCFRPPYGGSTQLIQDVASGLGFSSWLWTVDPEDWRRPGAPSIAYHVVANVRPGSVVLLHDGGGERSQTVGALAAILDVLTRQGYQFRSLPC